jgi:hypothetical protein
MLVQSLVIINGGVATAALAYYGAHNASGPAKSAAPLTIILYCLGVFTGICRWDSKMLRIWSDIGCWRSRHFAYVFGELQSLVEPGFSVAV